MATKKTAKKPAAKRVTAAKAKTNGDTKAKAKSKAKAKPAAADKAPKAGSKIAQLQALLAGKGTSTDELCKKLGWLPHTLRAAISRLPGDVKRERVDGVTSYRIEA